MLRNESDDYRTHVSEVNDQIEEIKMEFKDFLKEGWDSEEATDAVESISDSLNDKNLLDYMKVTDKNYSTKTVAALKEAQKAFNALKEEFYSAE